MRNSFGSRIGRHFRDLLIKCFPLVRHSSTGLEIRLRNRSEIRLYEQVFVENVFALEGVHQRLRKEDPVIFDLGANCGFFSLRALDHWPKASIHAFEPQRRLGKHLSETLLRNNLSEQVKFQDKAVGKEAGNLTFYENRSPISASLIKDKVKRRSIVREYQVGVITLDQYAEKEGIGTVDLLKIDVEGGELDALAGASRVLDMTGALFIEVHPPYATAEQVEAIGAKHGFARARELERDQASEHDLVFLHPDRVGTPG